MKILVLSSEKVKKYFSSYNLTPAEFLRPFTFFEYGKKFKVRTINNREKLIEDININFLDAEEYQSPTY